MCNSVIKLLNNSMTETQDVVAATNPPKPVAIVELLHLNLQPLKTLLLGNIMAISF